MANDLPFKYLNKPIPDDIKLSIADMILAWAEFDHAVTTAAVGMLKNFGLPVDVSSIFLGNMETKTKLERIKVLLSHFGDKDHAIELTSLLKEHKEHVEIRNAICHRWCMGLTRDEEPRLILASMRHRLGEIGNVEVFAFLPSEITRVTDFCIRAREFIMNMPEVELMPPRELPK